MDQHPMPMHGRMPIKTTIKRRMHLARTTHVVFVIDRVIGFVGILFLNALKSERGEVGRLGLSEGALIDRLQVGLNLKHHQQEKKGEYSPKVTTSHYRS